MLAQRYQTRLFFILSFNVLLLHYASASAKQYVPEKCWPSEWGDG
jgi:hypothetical protein